MTRWPHKPYIYEINTWVWLDTLSRDYNRVITLENVPDEALDELASYHVDAIWLMGIWQRSHAARASALRYMAEYRPALPDLTPEDVVGSPYAVGAYQPDEYLGGRRGLAEFRRRLRERGMLLVLDFVPNHVATDHAWVRAYPEYMVLGTPRAQEQHPDNFFSTHDRLGRRMVVAHGRDPYFPGWIDTAQINAFSPAARRATLNTLLDIAGLCDGVRCDMAMLMLNEIFAHTWRGHVGQPPASEFWHDIIPGIKAIHPGFLFIAEVYWDMESRLQSLGFDFTYDKRLYDRIRENKLDEIRTHLAGGQIGFQSRLVRFIENHDEHRAALLGIPRSQAAAVLICTLPGAVLLHDGQFTGRRVKLPVQIGRQPHEPVDAHLREFYLRLLKETRASVYQRGEWSLLPVYPAKDNGSHRNLIGYGWREAGEHRLIVVNLTHHVSQGHIPLYNWPETAEGEWLLRDILNGDTYPRQGYHLHNPGLYVELRPYQSHVFHFWRR